MTYPLECMQYFKVLSSLLNGIFQVVYYLKNTQYFLNLKLETFRECLKINELILKRQNEIYIFFQFPFHEYTHFSYQIRNEKIRSCCT